MQLGPYKIKDKDLKPVKRAMRKKKKRIHPPRRVRPPSNNEQLI